MIIERRTGLKRWVDIASRFCITVALLFAIMAFLVRWAINANALGARDMGLALHFSWLHAAALVGSLYAAPALVLLAAASLFFDKWSTLRFVAAAALVAAPLAVLTWA